MIVERPFSLPREDAGADCELLPRFYSRGLPCLPPKRRPAPYRTSQCRRPPAHIPASLFGAWTIPRSKRGRNDQRTFRNAKSIATQKLGATSALSNRLQRPYHALTAIAPIHTTLVQKAGNRTIPAATSRLPSGSLKKPRSVALAINTNAPRQAQQIGQRGLQLSTVSDFMVRFGPTNPGGGKSRSCEHPNYKPIT